MHDVEEEGEGPHVAELVMESYEGVSGWAGGWAGTRRAAPKRPHPPQDSPPRPPFHAPPSLQRDLGVEGMATVDPGDGMPHPGDAYLPPHALAARAAAPGDDHTDWEQGERAQGVGVRACLCACAWGGAATFSLLPPCAQPPTSRVPHHHPAAAADALRGADALYYAPEHAATPAVDGTGAGGDAGARGGEAGAAEEWDVEGDALRGSDAMMY